MLPPETAAAVGRYREALRARFGVRLREIRLFGSHARGDARADSDVDLLVLVDDLTWREAAEAIDLGADEEYRSGVLLAPIPRATADFERLRAMESPFAVAIDREGVLL